MLLDNAETIVTQLKGRWHGTFGLVKCPAHADSTPSLSIAQGRKGPIFKCHAGCEFRDIMRALRAMKIEIGTTEVDESKAGARPGYSLSIVEKIWSQAKPIAGTLGQRHLIARGLGMDHPHLRFNSRATYGPIKAPERVGPALIVPMHHDDRVVGVLRNFLDPAGRQHFGCFKPVLCSEPRAAMQLAPAGPVLALTEGWEDAIAYTRIHKVPAWGLPGIEWLAHTAVPDIVEELVIAFDRGKAAQAAFDKHVDRLTKDRRRVRFHPPPASTKDWNARLMQLLHGETA